VKKTKWLAQGSALAIAAVGVEIRRPEGWGGGLKPESRMIE